MHPVKNVQVWSSPIRCQDNGVLFDDLYIYTTYSSEWSSVYFTGELKSQMEGGHSQLFSCVFKDEMEAPHGSLKSRGF